MADDRLCIRLNHDQCRTYCIDDYVLNNIFKYQYITNTSL